MKRRTNARASDKELYELRAAGLTCRDIAARYTPPLSANSVRGRANRYKRRLAAAAALQADVRKARETAPAPVVEDEIAPLVLPDDRPMRADVFADAWRAVIAERAEAKRRARQVFTAALVVALLEADMRDAMLRALLRTLPLRERHKRRGFTLRWVPDGAGGWRCIETALQMAGD